MSRYVTVSTDLADKVIKDGPLQWDGNSTLTLPANQTPMLESAAILQGYTFPPIPPAAANATTLREKAIGAVATNVAYLAIVTPTQAQVVTQVDRLTRQVDGIIRLLLNQTDSTGGT